VKAVTGELGLDRKVSTPPQDDASTADRARVCERITIVVIGRSCLAAQYLMVLLQRDPRIRPLAFEDVGGRIAPASCPIFIFDNSCLLIPLGECLRRLQNVHPAGRYIVIDSNRTEEEIAQMLSLGVHGFVDQEEVPLTLRDAVQAVAEGRLWASPQAFQTYVKCTVGRARNGVCESNNPTPRESEVLELVKQRFTNKEIGQMLGVQESTIKFHLSNLYSKLHVDSRQQLTPAREPPFFWSEA
jgi:DNA-binding NarL/FixJ family response regulator